MTIRTPDQRLRVFVSSTLEELAEERVAVREVIEGLRLTPVMFELGARPHPPRALYRAYLEQSDVLIGVFGERYGWVAPGEQVSGVEDEYRLAHDLPKLIYLKEPAPDREPRLAALLARIRADDQVSYRRFGSADELRTLVANDLAVLLSERFRPAGPRRSSVSLLPPAERSVPHPLTRLIGRESEIERVTDMLADPSRRLVTIVGPGGIGKTRVALAVAERRRDAYADGIFYVPLASLREPALLVPTIARTLGISEDGGVQIGLVLQRALRQAHCLIVLDNLEQLTEAAPQVTELISETERVQLLATSRRVLDVGGEQIFELGPLELPATEGTTTAAIELFLERISAVRPGFQPNADDRAAIEELSRRLDGLPLAIELAAAQTRLLTPGDLLRRIGSRPLDFLANGPRDLPVRQQTLRKTIGWSYELLDPEARVLFRRMAVFVGGAQLDSIEAIANTGSALDTIERLGSLVEASLVRTIGVSGEVRFGMLETTREFAHELLEESGDAEGCRDRHTEHYLGLAAEGSRGLRGPGQLEWLDRFEWENDNFRALLRRSIRKGDAAAGVRMGLVLSWFWQMRNLYSEGREWMRAMRDVPAATAHDQAAAWTVEALLAVWQGDFEFVAAGVDEAVESLRGQGDHFPLGMALLLRAAVGGVEVGRPTAQEAAAEASVLLDTEGDGFLEAITLLGRSHVAARVGSFDEAARLAARALDLSASVGDSYIRSVASTGLATYALQRGAVDEARGHVLEALTAATELRNRSSAAHSLELWAAAELADGRVDRAGRLYALADRAYGLARTQPWRPDSLAASIDRLRRALGQQLDDLVREARQLDFDAAIAELARHAHDEENRAVRTRTESGPGAIGSWIRHAHRTD